ncbi:MAG: pyridoxal-phosphate dependent enzyme, partial [Longimicrobiales bacterium]
ALAMAASAKGYQCIFTMPDKMSLEKVKLLRAFGAEVVITPTAVGADHPDHYLNRAKAIAAATPGAVMANQFYNQANPEAHYNSTGPELWEQSEGRITHFFAGAGTGGTISGTGRFLKEKNPDIQVIGVDPVGSVLSGFFHTGVMPEGEPYKVEGLGNDKIPDTLHLDVIDDFLTVTDGEAFRMARRLVGEEGLFVGGSAGLIVHAALEKAREIDDPDAFVVAVLCDWGERYLSKQYDEEWMRTNGFLEGSRTTVAEMISSKQEQLPNLLSVTPATSVRMAISTLGSHHVSQLPVLVDGECVGGVGERELMTAVLEDPTVLEATVDSLMDAPYPVVDEHADGEAATGLLTRGAPAVLVRSGGRLDGILTRHDLVRSLAAGS